MARYFFFIIFFLTPNVIFSQVISNDFFPDSTYFLSQVKQLDEFMARFNNEEHIITNEVKSSSEIKEEKKDSVSFSNERFKVLTTLVNKTDTILTHDSTIISFLKYVSAPASNLYIHYADSNWFALVDCRFKSGKQVGSIRLTLLRSGNDNIGYKWLIAAVDPSFTEKFKIKRPGNKFISPLNHEMSFMDLNKVFNDTGNIFEYTNLRVSNNELLYFIELILTKKINYLNVSKIQFHFLQIKNWIFTVDYYNRLSVNAGWLISSIKAVEENDKKNYLAKSLFLK